MLAAACSGSATHPPGSGGSSNRGRIVERPVGGRLLGLHALPRGAELPRPQRRWKRPLEVDAAQLGVSDGLSRRPSRPACTCSRPVGHSSSLTHQCLLYGDCPPSLVAARSDARAEVRPVHALPRRAELARPHHQPEGGRPVFDLGGAGIDSSPRIRRRSAPRIAECRRLVASGRRSSCSRMKSATMSAHCPHRVARRRRGAAGAVVIVTASLGPAGGGMQRQPSADVAPAAHRMRQGRPSSPSAVGYSPACAPTGCRTSPTPTAADSSRRSTRSDSGSAAPSCRRPSKPAGSCSRTTAGRSTPARSNNA